MSHVYVIAQFEKNPRTGDDLHFGEANIKNALKHRTIKKWGYILHDKDTYKEKDEQECKEKLEIEYYEIKPEDITKEDYIKRELWKHAGQIKPRHWHVVVELSQALDIEILARWFGVEPQYVEKKKGYGALLDCVEYLTHENAKCQAEGKYLYSNEEVKANFDFRKELTLMKENKEKNYKYTHNDKYRMRNEVLQNGKTLLQCKNENPNLFIADYDKLRKMRALYLDTASMPPIRINYYIEGNGGMGKGVLSRTLAKALYPNLSDSECYFEVGGAGAPFESYDGQPVIIWNDQRASDLLKNFGGRGNVFNIFDSHPAAIRQNVKYSSTNLVNAVNIVNGVDSYRNFLDGLAGEYKDTNGDTHKAEDKGQAYRRFPMIIRLHENNFDCLVNRGFAEETCEYDQYINYNRAVGNFGEVKRKLDGKAQEVVLSRLTKPIIDKHHEVETHENLKISDPNQIPEEFLEYGKSID